MFSVTIITSNPRLLAHIGIHKIIFVSVALLMGMYGLGSGWLGPTLHHICNPTADFSLTSDQCSWVASLHYVGKIIGTFVAAMLVDVYGRNLIFKSCSLQFIVVWLLILCTRNEPALYFARMAFGVACGMSESIMPIYIAENCSPNIRGLFCSMAFGVFYGGNVIAYALTSYLSYDTVAIVHTAMAVTVLFLQFLLKETPQFLLMHGKEGKAEQHFIWLRGSETEKVKKEFDDIRNNMHDDKEDSMMSLADALKVPANVKSIRVVVLINILILCTGYPGINNFISKSLSASSSLSVDQLTILYGSIEFISISLSSTIIDRCNRRPVLFLGSIASFLAHISSAVLHHVYSTQDGPYYVWLTFATNTVYAVVFATILGPMFTVIRGELLHQRVKALGSSLALISNSATSFLVSKTFLVIQETYGLSSNYVIYSAASMALLIYTYFDVPETRGKSLVMIQQELKR